MPSSRHLLPSIIVNVRKDMIRYLCMALVLVPFSGNGGEVVSCAYVPSPTEINPEPELTPAADCGTLIDDDTLKVDGNILHKIYFGEDGLAVMRFKGSIFYINKSGKTAPTIYFDNGADYFVEGLARTTRKGKIGFMDMRLNVVIAPAYDFATPFSDGKAKVCNGCRKQSSDEHWEMVGGEWGEIDKSGNFTAAMGAPHDK